MMMKYALLAGAMMISAPAFAQDAQQAQPGRAPIAGDSATTASAPASASTPAPVAQPMDQVAPATPAQAAPTQSAQVTDPVTTPAQTTDTPPAQSAEAQPAPATPAQPAPAQQASQPAASGDQVATVVGKEFPTYDADKSGNLSQTEFASWMVALKKASDPATVADSAETKSWIGAAFAQADKDKSKSVTQAELTGFLSQGQS